MRWGWVWLSVAAGATDRREDLGGHPLLEALGGGLAAGENQAVEAGFVDDDEGLSAVACPTLDTIEGRLFVIIEAAGSVRRIADFEDTADVGEDEPRFTIAIGKPDIVAVKLERSKD